MIWRHRFLPDRFGWELPGGIVDAGESAAEAAARETEEETGWRPQTPLRHLLTFQPMVGMVDSPHELFIGHGADHVSTPRLDAGETGDIDWIPLSEIPDMIERDALLGAGTLVALLHILTATKATDR